MHFSWLLGKEVIRITGLQLTRPPQHFLPERGAMYFARRSIYEVKINLAGKEKWICDSFFAFYNKKSSREFFQLKLPTLLNNNVKERNNTL